jgi:hypothetical protein
MHRSPLIPVMLLLFAATPVVAQQFLPGSFGNWSSTGSTRFTADQLDSPGDATPGVIAKEYRFVSGEQCNYTSGTATLEVMLYHMKDPSGAYGEYSYLRMPDMSRAALAEHSAISRERALVLVGDLVLDIRGRELPRLKTDLEALATALAPQAYGGPLPTLWQRLPLAGIIERSDHYVLGPVALNQLLPVAQGDWLGFYEGAEAEVARYRLAGREVTLVVADFPAPQAAQARLVELEKKHNVNGPDQNVAGRPPALYAKRSLTLLAIVSGARSQREANVLLNQVRSATELTWNEPNFEATEPGILPMIAGAIIGTGIICGLAIVVSLVFGGFRLAVKRMLPGKVFDRPSNMQILQLGLSSKPINAEDFYTFGGSSPK